MDESVQPDAGQGGDDQGLYDLSSVPEEHRSHVEGLLKQHEANATKKFQEHADYRKSWEPYEQAGVNQYDPDDLASLLSVFSDEDQFTEWLQRTAQTYGIGQADDDDDGDYDEDEPLTRDEVQQLLQEQLAPFQQREQEQDEERAFQRATEFIDTTLAELHKEHGEFPDEVVCQLALAYEGEDSLAHAYQDYLNLVTQSEQGVFQAKMKQPQAPQTGGNAAQNQGMVTDFDKATAMALERYRQSNST